MPYCDDCAKYWAPSSMTPDGRCPRCGADLAAPAPALDEAGVGAEKVPWHFKLMIVALVVYLGYRFVQLGVELFS